MLSRITSRCTCKNAMFGKTNMECHSMMTHSYRGISMENGQSGMGFAKSTGTYGTSHVQEVVRQAHDELRQLLQQRAEVMRRIGTVKQTIVGLANLFGDSVLSEELLELVDRKSGGRQPGFTKACRMGLMEAARPLGGRGGCERD